jgi:hypothetical protein
MVNPFSHDAQSCKDLHAKMEDLLSGFVKGFRAVKRKIFRLLEKIEKSEKAKHLLNA